MGVSQAQTFWLHNACVLEDWKIRSHIGSSTLLIKTVKFQAPKPNCSSILCAIHIFYRIQNVYYFNIISSLCFAAESKFPSLPKQLQKDRENSFSASLTYFNMCWNSTRDTSLTEMVQYDQHDRPNPQASHDAGRHCAFQKPGAVAAWPLKCRLRSTPFLSDLLLTQQVRDCCIWKAIS